MTRTKPKKARVCLACRDSFTPARDDQVYCSGGCRTYILSTEKDLQRQFIETAMAQKMRCKGCGVAASGTPDVKTATLRLCFNDPNDAYRATIEHGLSVMCSDCYRKHHYDMSKATEA